MIATVLHFTTLSCFTIAVKHALRQRITQKPISLAELGLGVAVARALFVFNRRYIGLTLVALIISVAFGLVNSAWTAFFNPVQVTLLVPVTSMELDLSSPNFDALLSQGVEAAFANFSTAETGASTSLASVALMGGATTAMANASGQAGLFSFNNVQYNVSTSGILPAVKGYNGPPANNMTSPPSGPNPAMFFAGGPVPVKLSSTYEITGISSTYTLDQQGFTANVSCVNYNPGGWFPLNVTTYMANVTLDMDADGQEFIMLDNASLLGIICEPDGRILMSSFAQLFYGNTDSLMTLFCPTIGHIRSTFPVNNITIIHQGTGVYGFLPQTACTIEPLVTRSSVAYANQLISSTLLNSTAVSHQVNLMFWLGYFLYNPVYSFQSDVGNSLGSLLVSMMNPESSQAESSQAQVLLEEFWRGMVELAGTTLRSGFTAYIEQNQSLGSDMWIPMKGWQNVTTMGWSFSEPTHVYALFPITLTAVLTYVAIFYALKTVHGYDRLEQRRDSTTEEETLPGDNHERHFLLTPSAMATFDPSDPVHIVVASASGKLDHETKGVHHGDYWRQYERSIVSFRREEVTGQEDC